MSVSLEEIKSVKNLDQLKKLVAKPIIRRGKFISMSHHELDFLGRFLAIVALECSYARQINNPKYDFSRAIRFSDAIKNWYSSGRIEGSIYHMEALRTLSEGWYLDVELANDLKLYEFTGINYTKDPVIYFSSAFSGLDRLKNEAGIDILQQLKISLIYEEMDVYQGKFHHRIEHKY